MKIHLSGDHFRAGLFLLAMAACVTPIPSAYAGGQNDASDKYTGSIASTHKSKTQNTAPLISKNKGMERIDYTNICIYCHIPNVVNHAKAAPLLNNTIQFSPSTIQKANTKLP